MDEDDIDDFLDSNGDSENDGSKSHHHFDIINRNTSKNQTFSQISADSEEREH